MIWLGSKLVNEDCIASIEEAAPDVYMCGACDPNAEPALAVRLTSGDVLFVRCTMTDAVEALERAGLLDAPETVGVAQLLFSKEELTEMREAYANGFRYVAKDKNGAVYAYIDRPSRSGAYWSVSDGKSTRLVCGYAALHYDEAEPYDMESIFAVQEVGV